MSLMAFIIVSDAPIGAGKVQNCEVDQENKLIRFEEKGWLVRRRIDIPFDDIVAGAPRPLSESESKMINDFVKKQQQSTVSLSPGVSISDKKGKKFGLLVAGNDFNWVMISSSLLSRSVRLAHVIS